MRALPALLLTALLAAHGIWAGPASGDRAAVCGARVEFENLPGSHLLLPAEVLEGPVAESTRDGTEGPDGGRYRPAHVDAHPAAAVPAGRGLPPGDACVGTRSCLLGFSGHPSTAPPSQV